ncbi:ribonuclease P/MRP protein subunit RPP1, putative [Plasmodium sp. gorilla clade G3]|nr:ribonuclease P/MRP protein subunit RPP1, putative [Plasmodium sp. gorilla clade G3]
MYINLNIKHSSYKYDKCLIYKALTVGYNIVALSVNYNIFKNGNDNNNICDITWKVINCTAYNNNDDKNNNLYNNYGERNYFIDQLDNINKMNDYMLNINNMISENYILINRSNNFCIKNICDDFIFYENKMDISKKKNDINELLYNYIPKENYYLSNNLNSFILKRLNVKYQDIYKMEKEYNKIIKENNFDIIAFEIDNAEEINMIINKFDCDIIYFNMTKSFVSLRKSDIQGAIDKGIFFEISSFIKGNDDLQYVIYSLNLNNLFLTIPLNKLIISSGSIHINQIIDPLNFLRSFFNFNKLSYKKLIGCITTVPLACIQRASVRKSLNTAVFYKND